MQTASLSYLKYLGELVRVFQQPASTWNGTATITATGSSGSIDAGTQFVYSLSGVVYTVDTAVAIAPGVLTLSLTSGTSGDIGTLSNGSVLDIVTPIAGVGMTATASNLTSGMMPKAWMITPARSDVQKKPRGGPVPIRGMGAKPERVALLSAPTREGGYLRRVKNQSMASTSDQLGCRGISIYDPGADAGRAACERLNMRNLALRVRHHHQRPCADTPANRAAIDARSTTVCEERELFADCQ